ncbi:hypothetical protein ATKI12_8058 [Kitasatospora sp. Ki12]
MDLLTLKAGSAYARRRDLIIEYAIRARRRYSRQRLSSCPAHFGTTERAGTSP